MDYYEKMYWILLGKVVNDGTKHLYGRSYRDSGSCAVARNQAIGEVASDLSESPKGKEMTSADYSRLYSDLGKV